MINKLLNLIKLSFYRLRFNFSLILCSLIHGFSFKRRSLNKLKKNGYLIFENFLNHDECDLLKKKIDDLIFTHSDKVWKSEDSSADKRLIGINKINDQIIRKFSEDTNLRLIGEYFLGCKLTNAFTMANKLEYKKGNLGSGGGWHRDGINPGYKALIYLSDIDHVDDGALEIILDTNKFINIITDYAHLKRKNILDTRFKENDIEKLIKFRGYEKKSFIGKAGTVILFDTSYIHRGSPIKTEKKRYALTNYYFPKNKVSSELEKNKNFML